jgi:predicted transcriptional regulator
MDFTIQEKGDIMDKIDKMFIKMMDYALEHPDEAPKKVLVIDAVSLAHALTPARAKMLEVIATKKPETVGELVAILKRSEEAVSRDMRILANYGMLSFKHEGRQKMPMVERDLITMSLTV